MIYWLHVPHFVRWPKLKEMDCASEMTQYDVRSMTDALIRAFIAGPLMVSLLRCAPDSLYCFSLVSCHRTIDKVCDRSHQHFFPTVSLPMFHVNTRTNFDSE